MSSEEEVRKASQQFYSALSRMASGTTGAMTDVWAHGNAVTAMHPIGGRQVGWQQVGDSFDQVAQIASKGHVKLDDQFIQVNGDLAYELGVERGEATLAGQHVPFNHRVTNIYRREGGTWKIVHHHTDLSPAMLELLARLQASA